MNESFEKKDTFNFVDWISIIPRKLKYIFPRKKISINQHQTVASDKEE